LCRVPSSRLSRAAKYVADFTAAGERAAREARLNHFYGIPLAGPTANNNQPAETGNSATFVLNTRNGLSPPCDTAPDRGGFVD
jgi:hypothetical protein